MKNSTGFILLSVFLFLTIIIGNVYSHYTPHWAVHIKGGPHVAQKVAADHGFIFLDEIMPDYYHFQGHGVARRSIEPHDDHQAKLDSDHRVHWAQQQKAKSRKKRDYLSSSIVTSPHVKSSVQLNDLRWQFMWYLNRGKGLDMNVLPAWEEGITGKGVVVTILDDGLEKDHPDLIRNFDPLASYDVNNHDEDPMPRYDMIDSNRHGTRCAGEVAAAANNTLCAVGVAYGASVGGVRMLDGDVTDAVEARSLSLNPQHIDIYSASWGPDDDGKTVDGPGELATRAFIEGVTKGRGGKGSIFVWASGNGGRDKDNCNCDGYTNSIWTLSISSATESGHVPWYSEACSSTLATTYSSGSVGEKQVVTTDLHHSCTSSHTGTSASAPLAAGICALALEANPNLTWRDMQHIVVRTAKTANLKANDWQVNGVGRNVSHSFGYGLMDASAMVRVARSWKTVPEQHKCEISAQITDPTIPPKSRKKFSLIVKNCPGVNYLEHVQAKITLTTLRRGDLEINLTSPAGTRSTLLEHRFHDFSRQGFLSWPFMSVHTWGEKPFGEWKLEIHNEGRTLNRASLQQWSLVLYGTVEPIIKADKSYTWPDTNYINLQNNITQSKHTKGKNKNNPSYNTNPKKAKNKNKNQKNNGKSNQRSDTLLKGISKPKIYKPGIDSDSHPNQNTTSTRNRQNQKKNQKYQKNYETLTTPAYIKIPSVLQQYPKVQHIYPALYPYTKSGTMNTPRDSSLYFTMSENRPLVPKNSESSRDVQSSHRKGKKYTQESLVLITNTDIKTQKSIDYVKPQSSENVQGQVREVNTETSELPSTITSTVVTNGSISKLTEWELILHGTETLPNAGITKPAWDEKNPGGSSEIQINDLDQGMVVSSNDRWRGEEPQVGEELSHVNLQDATENVFNSSACAKSNGRICLDCLDGYVLYYGICIIPCPRGYFTILKNQTTPTELMEESTIGIERVCEECHYSCLTCRGPNDFECTLCHEDSVLTNITATESYCYPALVAYKIHNTKWFYRTYIIMLIALVIIFCAGSDTE
ncbi:furin-like protease 1 [Chrysoperla carnea]|uniref:furin-like protease 1 n=1 Tax=Chrysoperla carnea TaxID=189513 RepID=UPI001D08B125|nr:furin-like protease 1 [Chrysoperla carnea]